MTCGKAKINDLIGFIMLSRNVCFSPYLFGSRLKDLYEMNKFEGVQNECACVYVLNLSFPRQRTIAFDFERSANEAQASETSHARDLSSPDHPALMSRAREGIRPD